MEGSLEAIRQETQKIIEAMGKRGFMLGADCTVPGEIDWPACGQPWKPPRKYKEEIIVKQLSLGGVLQAPAIALGRMRINSFGEKPGQPSLNTALENG